MCDRLHFDNEEMFEILAVESSKNQETNATPQRLVSYEVMESLGIDVLDETGAPESVEHDSETVAVKEMHDHEAEDDEVGPSED